MPSDRVDPVDRTLPAPVAPVRAPLLTPVEREAERRRREERRRRRRDAPPEPPADPPRLDIRG